MTPLSSQRWLAAALAAFVLAGSLVATPVRAEVPLLRDSYYEFAPYYQTGGVSLGGHDAEITGIHIQERNGYFGKAIWTVLVATLMALGASDREYLGSDYGPGYRIDYYRMKSPEEMAYEEAQREATVDAAAANEYQTDLKVFFPVAGTGDTRGYIFETYPASFNAGRFTFDIGFGMTHIRSKCGPEMKGGVGRCGTDSISIPFRTSFDIAGIAILDLQFDMNFLAFDDDTRSTTYDHGFKLGATLHPWQRAFVRGGMSIPDFDFGELGFSLEAGVRF